MLFSELSANTLDSEQERLLIASRCLIVDNIGWLSSLYQYADWAHIGGGYGKGIHNVLEAAVYGLALSFGPNYKKFNEAVKLRQLGAAFVLTNEKEVSALRLKLETQTERDKLALISREYVEANLGACEKAVNITMGL